MSMNSRFDARFWLVTLSALLVMGITFSLGAWQLNRAAEKQALSQSRTNAELMRLTGRWDAAQTVYVDNRQMTVNGQLRQGFFVVTPLLTSSTDYVLVERGWIARHFDDRKKLENITTPSDDVTIEARALADPQPPAVFALVANTELPIVQFLDLPMFAKALPNRAYKGRVQQIGAPSEGLQRYWYEPASGVEKHYGYAFQWFALCVLAAGLYIWFQWIKNEQN